jgi:opacity protein-like surface antigen
MMRTGAPLRRVFALASLCAGFSGLVSTANAQYDPTPRLFPEPYAAHPIGANLLPPVSPVGYYDNHAAAQGGACVAGVPCDAGVAGNPWDGVPVCNPCDNMGCDSCSSSPCGGCGVCDDCGCNECVSCRPCYAGPRCMDPWYVSLSGGWQHRETVHEETDPLVFLEFAEGFAVNGALGYRFDNLRVETEYTFMNNEVDTAGGGAGAAAAGISPSPATGNVNLRALMFNIYYDLDLPFSLWRPYLGAGIGFYQSEINSLYPDFFGLAGPAFNNTPVNTTSDTPLAYQFRVGASRSLGERTEFFAGYRYFRGEDLTFASAPFASPLTPTFNPDGAEVHSAEVGLRVRF